ncbi:hypothetical protein [Streptomyces tagetis]|uniref:Uncharacterized protein n=1 Tax=Streptomyces tagetis TaxID=2820809 RepID=A0A940XPX6_9ACTN|nr:hypothetical protein [Streptomyces sp. RG38]MBQ0830226.1 hypothetical protein [Streptomyces sp. RG38]
MPTEPSPTADDPAFRAWLQVLSDELDTDIAGRLGSPEVFAFLRTTFARNGAMPAAHFAPLLSTHRRVLAERTVTALLEQVRQDTGRVFVVPVFCEPPHGREPTGLLTIGNERVRGVDPIDISVETAEGVQCLLADRDRLLWPLCPDHGTAPHTTRTPAGATWLCSVTSHVVRPLPA